MIKLIAIGKNKDKALQSLEKEYMKRLSAFCKFSEIEVKDEAENKTIRVSPAAASCIMASIKARDYIKDQTYTQTVDGKKQEITTTVVTPKLRDDLNYRPEKITIPLPDLKSQKIIADKYYAKINEIKELKYKLEKATAELEHIYTEEK